MTLILTINGRETIWLLADRRLSYKNRAPRDDARKAMILETPDGTAILGYAGLGATALGTEPADWMSAVLRGRNLPLEQSLSVLADAMKKQFPRHLVKIPRNNLAAHNVMVTSFLGNEVKLYSIDLAFASDRKSYRFRYTRWQSVSSDTFTNWTPRLGAGGTGGMFLNNDKKWMRSLLNLIKANDHRKVSTKTVADHLAKLNYEVHLNIGDKSVGPSCIVAWRHRKEGIYKGGGGQSSYTGITQDKNTVSLPLIVNGIDLQALSGVLMPDLIERFGKMKTGFPETEIDKDKLNEKLARLPSEPDENLR